MITKMVEKEVKEAYADCWLGYEKGKNRRNLDFKASKPVSKNEASRILKEAIPYGYNEFKSSIVDNLPNNVKIIIAREGSVCLYIKNWKNPSNEWMIADEFEIQEDGTVRLWWD